ncbi:MAG: FGGY family carbohydrate kinase, partial [Coriobacteriia bacterium]|nr:FGGY family carbohydrate kinase [Coriobacteriia bacterium]
MDSGLILALDQGTTSSRALLFDHQARLVGSAQHSFEQIYPKPAWVEHDPQEILSSQFKAVDDALAATAAKAQQIAAIGISNQRETTLVWDKKTGKPIANAIVWQCRRTSEMLEQICKDPQVEEGIIDRTGLVPDAYFSATKIAWLLNEVPGARAAAKRGELAFGTVDTWLVYQLTGGLVHATDITN